MHVSGRSQTRHPTVAAVPAPSASPAPPTYYDVL
jgi:hypothetical protein